MSLDCLRLEIDYDIGKDSFEIRGNVGENHRRELVETFLRRQIGTDRDENGYVERNVYHLRLDWNPEEDTISSYSDAGNMAMRDRILMQYLKSLDK